MDSTYSFTSVIIDIIVVLIDLNIFITFASITIK